MPWSIASERRRYRFSDTTVRIVAVVQARMGSTRLPGKVLAPVAGRTMIARVLDRAERISGVAEVAVAIPSLAEDDALELAVRALGCRVVRGSASDVLDRYLRAATETSADAVVRITADCPLLSAAVSTKVVDAFAMDAVDYASNTLERTFPRGLDTEVVRTDVLRAAAQEAEARADREHVTLFVWRQPDRFRLRSVTGAPDRSALRWTVDTDADLAFVRAVCDELGEGPFEMEAILDLLERRPDLQRLNADVVQKPVD